MVKLPFGFVRSLMNFLAINSRTKDAASNRQMKNAKAVSTRMDDILASLISRVSLTKLMHWLPEIYREIACDLTGTFSCQ